MTLQEQIKAITRQRDYFEKVSVKMVEDKKMEETERKYQLECLDSAVNSLEVLEKLRLDIIGGKID